MFQMFHCLHRKKRYTIFSMAIGNVVLVQQCFLKHMSMGTAGMKEDKETEESKILKVNCKEVERARKKNSGRRNCSSGLYSFPRSGDFIEHYYIPL